MNIKPTFMLALLGMALSLSFSVAGQTEKQVESTIKGVTVFLSKAQVTRELKTRVGAGKTDLVITGLTANLDPNSIQVTGKGDFIILGTSHRQNFITDLQMPKAMMLLKDSLEYFQRQMSLEQSQKEILSKEEGMLMANQKVGGANQNLTVSELKVMVDFYRSRLGEIAKARMKQDELITKVSGKMTRIQAQINSQNELYRRNTSEIVVSISADAATPAELELNYIVSNAGWNPVYDLRVVNTKGPVQLAYKANVFQSTGEEWKGIRLKLSTANPNLGGLKPELATQFVDFYQPIVYKDEITRKAKTAMPMAVGREDGFDELSIKAETSASLVNTLQTSLNTEFEISMPYTVPSSSKPMLVDIRNHELKAIYQYAVAPKLDRDAFLLAKATGWEEFSLLPGVANVFFEGTFVGKSLIDPHSIRDTLSLSLGRDKRLVVKREKVRDFTSRKALGSNIREAYAFELSVRNTRQEPVTLTLEDQVPVTKNSLIEVTVTDTGGAIWNKDTGKLVWTWTLAPNETRKVILKFEVKYPKDKQIGGL